MIVDRIIVSLSRYTDPVVMTFLHESFCLDPRFKALAYLLDEEKERVYQSLINKAEKINQMSEAVTKVKI